MSTPAPSDPTAGTADPGDGPAVEGCPGPVACAVPGDGSAFRCAEQARLRGDPMFASAPPARRWLLVEHPGPWGRDALDGAGFPEEVADALDAFCRRHSARFQLIRRTGSRGVPSVDHGRFAVVDSTPGAESARWGQVAEPSELPAALADLDASTEPDPEPVYLICAHGRHDACCAMRGRPLAAVLAAAYPTRVWETTHTGGDRFAPNLVLLPHGLLLGQVAPHEALDVVAGYEAGDVDPERIRGRAGLDPPVQGAQHHARRELAERGVAALDPVSAGRDAAGDWVVRLDGGHRGVVRVVVRERWVDAPTPLTCSGGQPGSMRTYDLVTIGPDEELAGTGTVTGDGSSRGAGATTR